MIFFIFSTSAFSALESLPLGGKIKIDKTSWSAKTLDSNLQKTMIIIHKKHQDLQGYVIDGHPKIKESCNKKKSGKSWVLCSRSADFKNYKNVQYVLERQIGKKAYQTYFISFNVDKKNLKAYLPILKAFESHLESGI